MPTGTTTTTGTAARRSGSGRVGWAAAAASVRGPLHAMRHASLVALRAVEGWGSPVLWACGVQWVRRTTVDGGARASTTRYPVTLTVALRAPAWRGRACTLE